MQVHLISVVLCVAVGSVYTKPSVIPAGYPYRYQVLGGYQPVVYAYGDPYSAPIIASPINYYIPSLVAPSTAYYNSHELLAGGHVLNLPTQVELHPVTAGPSHEPDDNGSAVDDLTADHKNDEPKTDDEQPPPANEQKPESVNDENDLRNDDDTVTIESV